MQAWFIAFPDLHVRSMNRLIGEDWVTARLEFTGTNTGPLVMDGMESPATGGSVVGGGAYFARVRDGLIVEFRSHLDTAGMMTQLGLVPRG